MLLNKIIYVIVFMIMNEPKPIYPMGARTSLRKCGDYYNGTTPNLQEIVIGRCFDFFNTIHPNDCQLDPSQYDCQKIWTIFSSIIINKSPCSLNISDFDQFFDSVNHPIEANTSLFWSGTNVYAHESIFLCLLKIFD